MIPANLMSSCPLTPSCPVMAWVRIPMGMSTSFASPHAPSDAIIVSDPNLLLNGDFRRSGVDLIVSKDDHELVLQDYFRSEKRAALSSPDGAHLTGNIVNALTGHVEYAQARGAPDAAKVIGHIQTAIGSGTLTRACGIAVQAKVGDPVCQGDVIETAADGRVGLRFIDGTGFKLSGGARMVLDEFVCDGNGTSHSALFGVTRGTFAFIVGQLAETGCLRIDTPVGSIRGRARTGGIGMMSLTALIFSLMKEVEAAEFSSQRPLLDSLDDDKINPKDLQLNGTIELFMRDGRHYTLDDPSQTIVISGSGSISVVTNSATQMAELQRFQQEALAAYALGTPQGQPAQVEVDQVHHLHYCFRRRGSNQSISTNQRRKICGAQRHSRRPFHLRSFSKLRRLRNRRF